MEKEDRIREVNADITHLEAIRDLTAKCRSEVAEKAVQVESNMSELLETSTKTSVTPTVLHPLNSERIFLSRRNAAKRVGNTVKAVAEIHGEKEHGVRNGLWATLVKISSPTQIQKLISKSPKCKKKANEEKKKGEDNTAKRTVTSVKVMYKNGVLSKRKYNTIRVALKTEMPGKSNLLTYDNLISHLNQVCDKFPLTQIENGLGRFRNCELLLIELASVYLKLDKILKECGLGLNWFGKPPGSFVIAIGADGAPAGKHKTNTSLLISLLNLGKHVASCDYNYVLFGGDVAEDDPEFMSYVEGLCQELEAIEKKRYEIDEVLVTFEVGLLPADNKWLATVNGELSNAATYPSSFANAHKDDLGKMDGSIGTDSSQTTWQPWDYQKRLRDAEQVKRLKSSKSNRSKITKHIASMKSRQEFTPTVGRFADVARIDPLHTKNNMCQQINILIFNTAIAKSKELKQGMSMLSDAFLNTPFGKYLYALKNQVKANKLYIRLKRWYQNEFKASNPNCQCNVRFTGEDSNKFCNGYVHLLEAIEDDESSIRLLALHYLCLQAREAVALFSKYDISVRDLTNLETCCRNYHRCHNLFFAKITLTTWHVGYVVPYHTRLVFEKFGVGLGLNTMQGREAKHRQITNLSVRATPQNSVQTRVHLSDMAVEE